MATMPQVLMLPVSSEIVMKIAEELVRKWIAAAPKVSDAETSAVGSTLDGGKFVGVTVHDGCPMRLVLLPGEFSGAWEDAKAWCEAQGGQLPSRFDLLTLWQNARGEFRQEAYWSHETYPSDASYVWYQSFDDGGHDTSFKSAKLRACAVHRLAI